MSIFVSLFGVLSLLYVTSAEAKFSDSIKQTFNNFKDTYIRVDINQAVKKAQAMQGQVQYNMSVDKQGLRIMTFNLRYKTAEKDRVNNWANRLPRVLRLIADFKPDVIGFQEVLAPQLKDVSVGLKKMGIEYGTFGQARSSSGLINGDEYNPLFFLTSNQTILTGETLGLNPSHKIGVKIGNTLPRIVTYGVFKNNNYGSFIVFNLHLENQNSAVRAEQAKVLLDIVNKWSKTTLTPFIIGDFNCVADAPVMTMLAQNGFENTNAGEASFHAWQGWKSTIDHILHSGEKSLQKKGTIRMIDPKLNQEIFPSDHRPVFVDFH